MQSQSTSIATGLIVATLGALPLLLLFSQLGAPNTAPTTTDTTITVIEEPPTEGTVVMTPPPVVDGLTENVVRVLVSRGYALEEVSEDLPESVVSVLSERGIALTIAEEG